VPIGLASLIIASVPLWLVVLRSATGDRPGRGSLAGTAVGFLGVALLLRPGGGVSIDGVLLVVVAAMAWALGSFVSSRLPMPGDAIATTGIQALTGGVLLLPVGAVLAGDESLSPSDWSSRSVIGLAYLIVFGSIVGYTAYVWLLGNVPLGTVATYAYVNPLVAISLGVVFLDEVVTWQILAGAVVILSSVALVISREMPRRIDRVHPPLIET
jgi:drug/metabolite transporter (DMT)-like permease